MYVCICVMLNVYGNMLRLEPLSSTWAQLCICSHFSDIRWANCMRSFLILVFHDDVNACCDFRTLPRKQVHEDVLYGGYRSGPLA